MFSRAWMIFVIALLAAGTDYVGGELTENEQDEITESEQKLDSSLTGKTLIERHCTGCHLEPNPTDLPEERDHDSLGGMTPAEALANANISTLELST